MSSTGIVGYKIVKGRPNPFTLMGFISELVQYNRTKRGYRR